MASSGRARSRQGRTEGGARPWWPWALAAAVAGAVAGAGVVLAARRAHVLDVPGAQDPEDVEAVVDRGTAPGHRA